MDFFGDPFPEMYSMSFLHYTNRMSYQDYMIALINGKYHFSITPLGGVEDEENLLFNRCKNPFKYLNYGMARVPGIYSKTPIYQESIVDIETGVLVDNTKDSWLRAMDLMASDAELRKKIRRNAFYDVVENHHIKFSAEKLTSLLK